jgi:hypothetical protein
MLLSACSSLFDALHPVFTRSVSYRLVCGILVGMMLAQSDTTLTNVYLSLTAFAPDAVRRYWSLEQVLRRRSWQVEALITAFAKFLFATFASGRFIADVTHTTTQGKHQAARGFRKNPHYHKGYENQSKFLADNDVLPDSLLLSMKRRKTRAYNAIALPSAVFSCVSRTRNAVKNTVLSGLLSGLSRKGRLFSTTVAATMPRPSTALRRTIPTSPDSMPMPSFTAIRNASINSTSKKNHVCYRSASARMSIKPITFVTAEG